MFIEKLFPSGDYLVSTIHNGYYVKMRYNGYTKRECIALFRAHIKTL